MSIKALEIKSFDRTGWEKRRDDLGKVRKERKTKQKKKRKKVQQESVGFEKKRGDMQCTVALCFLQSQRECSCMSYPVHQLSLNPGGLFSDTILTDGSHHCSICVCVYICFCSRIYCMSASSCLKGWMPPVCVCVCTRVYVLVGDTHS